MVESKSWADTKHDPSPHTHVLNPIRYLLENKMKIPKEPRIPLVNLGLGEPSKANGFTLHPVINEAIIEQVKKETCNGYTMSSGIPEAKQAIAEKFGNAENPIDPNNVFLTFGTSGALYAAISVLCHRGDNILAASPGFPLFQPICQNLEVNFKNYNLLPEKDWEIDLVHLESLIDSKTKAILVNNPSNPCGSAFTKEHQLAIIAIANKHKIPIIADEVYYGMVYGDGYEFNSFANLTQDVPILCTGALSKIYTLPGWRCGWLIVYNRHNYFDNVLVNLSLQSAILLHPCSLVQYALPKILKEVPDSYFAEFRAKIKDTSSYAFEKLQGIRAIKPTKANAAMYMMVAFDVNEFKDIKDTEDFAIKILEEECVLLFPSEVFFAKGFFRIILCTKKETIDSFVERLTRFCAAHYK